MTKKTLLYIGAVVLFICLVSLVSSFIDSFIPKYEFYSDGKGNVSSRCNKINGKVEYYSSESWSKGWKEMK